MERIVITIRPSGNERLDVADAMQQVIDYFALLSEAEKAIASPEESFTWKLERASTNTPFTVVGLAVPLHPNVDISRHAQKVKNEVSSGMRGLMDKSTPAWWMSANAIQTAGAIFRRTTNGISHTEVENTPEDKLVVDQEKAVSGAKAITAIRAISVDDEIGPRNAYGEVQGIMVGAGRFYNAPAIQIRTEQYPGVIYCILPARMVKEFGDAHAMREIWEGKHIGVSGQLVYSDGGTLRRIQVEDIRELQSAPPIELEKIIDKDFTSGLDPVEYLRQLHEGELA